MKKIKIRVTSEPSLAYQKYCVELERELEYTDAKEVTNALESYQKVANNMALKGVKELKEKSELLKR